MLSLEFNDKELRRSLKELGEKTFRQVASQSINKALTGSRTEATRYLSPKIQVKRQSAIRDRITLFRSKPQKLVGEMIVAERGIPLTDVKNVTVRGKNTRSQVVRWKGRQVKGAFRIKGMVKSLKDPIFIRYWRGKNGYGRAFAYTLLQEYEYHKTPERIHDKAQERLDKEFTRLLNRRLSRLGFR